MATSSSSNQPEGDLLSGLQHLIECPVCMENMNTNNKPKILPCQHTLCEQCINKLPQHICPLCRKPFHTEDLPTNLTFVQISGILQLKNKVSHQILCEYCLNIQQEISHYCKDCDEYFCVDCARQHSTLCKNHTTPVCITDNSCLKHRRTFTMYCLDCKILLCVVCAHQNVCCKNTNKTYIENIKKEKTQDLQKIIEKISSDLQLSKNIMSKGTLNSRLIAIKEITQKVKTHTQKLRDRLNQRENELMKEINVYENELKSSIDLVDSFETLTQLKETGEAALRGGIEQILLTLPSIQAGLLHTASKEYQIDVPGPVTFKPEDSMLVGHLHQDKNEEFESGSTGRFFLGWCFVKGLVMVVTNMHKEGYKYLSQAMLPS